MLIRWEWNLGGGPAGQPNLCFWFLGSSGRGAIGEGGRACRANVEEVVGSEKVGQTGRTGVKASSMEDKPSSSQTHSYSGFFGGWGGIFFILGEFHEDPI